MSRPLSYTWNGEPIPDIRAWARERGEKMVRVRKTWNEPDFASGEFITREVVIEMPVSFWSGLRFGGPDDTRYSEIERFDV